MKILHIITGLNPGGAQLMLLRLLGNFRESGPEGEVISLAAEGPLAPPIRELGVPVTCLGLPEGPAALMSVKRIGRLVQASRADLVQCWMYHANFLGGLATWLYGHMPLLWGLRQSNLDPVLSKKSTVAVAQLCGRMSPWLPRSIICVSESARLAHIEIGYAPERMVVIENGFDLDVFRPSDAARAALRAQLGLDDQALLIGLAARFDPQKGIEVFLKAAVEVARDHPGARFVLCGDGMVSANIGLRSMIGSHGLADRISLLGHRTDIAQVMAALDIVVSSSGFGEGFPNSLGEALCCGVPAVATDVGDSRLIVQDAGRVVPPAAPAALARGVKDLLALGREGRRRLGEAGRARMAREFTIDTIARRYRSHYLDILSAYGTNDQ